MLEFFFEFIVSYKDTIFLFHVIFCAHFQNIQKYNSDIFYWKKDEIFEKKNLKISKLYQKMLSSFFILREF